MISESDITLKLKAQIFCANEIAIGPGKADLLKAIDAHGSISAAARVIGLSYRRAWMMVDTMNHCWRAPLVESKKGGRSGAKLTEYGRKILLFYNILQNELNNIRMSDAACFLVSEVQFNEDESS